MERVRASGIASRTRQGWFATARRETSPATITIGGLMTSRSCVRSDSRHTGSASSWSRIMPTGRGRVNRAGLAFYERLVDGLFASNIQPVLTLFHWDLPADLEDRGGWRTGMRRMVRRVRGRLVRALDDRVPLWVTINEPWVSPMADTSTACWHRGTAVGSRRPASRTTCSGRTRLPSGLSEPRSQSHRDRRQPRATVSRNGSTDRPRGD